MFIIHSFKLKNSHYILCPFKGYLRFEKHKLSVYYSNKTKNSYFILCPFRHNIFGLKKTSFRCIIRLQC